MAQRELNIVQEQTGDIWIFRVSGKLDFSSTPLLEEKLKEIVNQYHYKVIFDFTNLTYISSPGLRLLLQGSKITKNLNGKLVIFGLQHFPKEIIKDSNFDFFLEIAETEKDALDRFKS